MKALTEKQTEKVAKRIKRLVIEWIPIFGLDHWSLDVVLAEKVQDKRAGPTPAGRLAVASAQVDWAYQEALLRFTAAPLHKIDQDELTSIVVHELAHLHLDEMRFATDTPEGVAHEEHTTVNFTGTILRAYEAGYIAGLEDAGGTP